MPAAYFVELAPGTYRVSTRLGFGHRDQLYDGVPCPGGPASSGGCDPLTGDPVTVSAAGPTAGIDFMLAPPPLFADDFKWGDVSAWSGETAPP